jgi:hypothetical protein
MASVVVRVGSNRSWRPGIALMSNAVRGMHSGSLAWRAAAMAFWLLFVALQLLRSGAMHCSWWLLVLATQP